MAGGVECWVRCARFVLVRVHVVLSACLDRQCLQGAGLVLEAGEGLESQGDV